MRESESRAEIEKKDLSCYDWIVVNTSGGKDSQTMLDAIVELADSQGFPREKIVATHADLGRAEWNGTAELAERQARHYAGIGFEKISRPQGDLLDHIEARGKFPSSAARYCTSDHKRGQIAKILTKLSRETQAGDRSRVVRVLNCLGLRSEESPARAKRPNFIRDKRASSKTRLVDTWLPIQEWKEGEVWNRIRETGVEHHVAYDLGMPRLSCVFCIFAPKPALVLAGKHNRELLSEYVRIEKKIDHKFRKELALADVQAAVEADEEIGSMSSAWNM
jgi:3'-phosphoadenosine 5'-phosphosulfate sulfotransferase (PAPS reductase)/FAD synthetase